MDICAISNGTNISFACKIALNEEKNCIIFA